MAEAMKISNSTSVSDFSINTCFSKVSNKLSLNRLFMININANKGKSSAGYTNKLRSEGFIPAILYGGKK